MVKRMNGWILFSVLALLSWGIWGFLPKLALDKLDSRSIIVFEVVGSRVVGIVVLALLRFRPQIQWKGILIAVLTGVLGMLGAFFFVLAVSRGKTSVIVTLTALYPLVTIILALVFLREPITLKQGAGMVLALGAMVLFTV